MTGLQTLSPLVTWPGLSDHHRWNGEYDPALAFLRNGVGDRGWTIGASVTILTRGCGWLSARSAERTIADPDRLMSSHSNRLVAERATAAGNTLRVVYEEMEGGATAFVWTVIRIGGRTSS